MKPEDQELRTLFLARGNRTGWVDVDGMVEHAMESRPSPVLAKLRPALSALGNLSGGILVVVVLASIGVGALLLGGVQSPPTGLWQSKAPVGTGVVGSKTCVAVDLSETAYKTGDVTLWWWAPGEGESDCRTSSSGPMEAVATLASIPVADAALGTERSVFRIQLDLELVGSGTERIEFVLDPFRKAADAASLAGFAGADLGGRALEFNRVQSLDVTPPGGVPAPTPPEARST